MSKFSLMKSLLSQMLDELNSIERENEPQKTPSLESNPAPERQDLRGIRALARYLQISTATAQRMKNEGIIPFYCIGDRTYFRPDEVDEAVKNTKKSNDEN